MAGGLGGLGRSMASWMITQGARNFVFISKSGGTSPKTVAFMESLASLEEGVNAIIACGDVSNREDVEAAISLAKSPIRGVVQAAMVLKVCTHQSS